MRASNLDVIGCDFESRTTRNAIPDAVIRHHVRECLRRGLPELEAVPAHDRVMVIAGSGPSLADVLYDPPGDIFAVGGAHDWLLRHGVRPHAWINADPSPLVANYCRQTLPEVTYYLASVSHPFTFNACPSQSSVVWHNEVWAGTADVVKEFPLGRERIMVMGGSTTAMRAPFLGHELGYRKFVFYGVDGSGGHLAARQRAGTEIQVEIGGKRFEAPIGFVHQAHELERIIEGIPEWTVEVRGNGMMAAVASAATNSIPH